MEVASSNDVGLAEVSDGLAEALTRTKFLSYVWQGGASTKPPSHLARRYRYLTGYRGAVRVEGPFVASGKRSGSFVYIHVSPKHQTTTVKQ